MIALLDLGLCDEEVSAIKEYISDVKSKSNGYVTISSKDVYKFIDEKNRGEGMFNNCIVLTVNGHIVVERVVGW